MAAKKKATSKAAPAKSIEVKSYKALMIMKGKKLLPRGVKFSCSRTTGSAMWTGKNGNVILRMDLADYARSRAKEQGFAVD